jgi:hypothetical protein
MNKEPQNIEVEDTAICFFDFCGSKFLVRYSIFKMKTGK